MGDIHLNDSEVEIVLDGETHKLIASPQALLDVSNFRGGMRQVASGIISQDVQIYILLLRIGLQLEAKDEKEILHKIFRSRIATLTVPLAEYMSMLGNGGIRIRKEEGEGRAGEGKNS